MSRLYRQWLCVMIVLGTITALAGTDLVLPAIPSLPDTLGGNLTQAQFVLAAFTAGISVGLLFFGELGARFNHRYLLIAALAGYAGASYLAATADSMSALIYYRIIQGFVAAAPAVLAPAMVRALFDDRTALRAIGLIGSIESMAPALAPILGAWLLTYFDWKASFYIIAVISVFLVIGWLASPGISAAETRRSSEGYLPLVSSAVFLRYALSQACTLGGLLVFVFGAPTVMTVVMGGTLSDFVIMQVIGITLFVIASNTAHFLVDGIGPENTILFGSSLAAVGAWLLLFYAFLWQVHQPVFIWALFSLVNLGLGFRGPPGFYRAMLASGDNDARGSALVILACFAITAAGTALLAPFINIGLLPLAAAACAITTLSVLFLLLLPRLEDTVSGQ